MAALIRDAIVDLVAVTGRDLSSVTIYAGDEPVTVCAMLITWSGGADDPLLGLPEGVSGKVWRAWPRTLALIPSMALDELHAEAMAAAWQLGAWDVSMIAFPPPAARQPHVLWSGDRDDLDDVHGVAEPLRLATRAGGLREWSFRPLFRGPALRRRRWATRDTTVSDAGERPLSSLPAMPPPPRPVRDTPHQTVFTLGRSP